MIINESILDLIGNTPLVDVSVLSPNRDVRIVAKLENQNPFGSVKDRIAKLMIETAEKNGDLVAGQTIVEPSSGNTASPWPPSPGSRATRSRSSCRPACRSNDARCSRCSAPS